MSNIKDLTVAQLRQIVEIREQIETLEAQLAAIGGRRVGRPPSLKKPGSARTGRRMSAAGRAAIAAAARARWAKFRAETGKGAKPAGRKKRRFSAAARAKMAAAVKARWAKAKASGKNAL